MELTINLKGVTGTATYAIPYKTKGLPKRKKDLVINLKK